MISYYHTIILARVAPRLTEKNHLGDYFAAEATYHHIADKTSQVLNSNRVWDRKGTGRFLARVIHGRAPKVTLA